MLSKVDQEDLWVKGFVFLASGKPHYEDDFNAIKDHLLTPEFEQKLIDDFSLEDDLFGGDTSFKLIDVYWNYKAVFVFQNEDEETEEFCLAPDHVTIAGL